MSYNGPERRNGTSLEKVHSAILDTQSEVRKVRDAQIETKAKLGAIKENMERGERRFADHDRRIRENSIALGRGEEAISNLKSQARKSGSLAGGASGGITGALLVFGQWLWAKMGGG